MGDNKHLPFDLYTRNKITCDLVYLNSDSNIPLNILDVGGRGGNIKDFLDIKDKLYILDIRKPDTPTSSYFLGNIKNSPFKKNTFDFVISLDVYEHIPEENRLESISEMLRISKGFIVLGAPFDSTEVHDSEITANDYFKKISGNNHPWLEEHINNGLPSHIKLEQYLIDNKMSYRSIPTNNVSIWLLLQLLIFYSHRYHFGYNNLEEVFEYYNNNALELGDNLTPTYRTIYIINKNDDEINIIDHSQAKLDTQKYSQLISKVFDNLGKLEDIKENNVKNITDANIRINESLKSEIANLTTINESYKNEIANLNTMNESYKKEIAILSEKLNLIYNSIAWRILSKYKKLRKILLKG